MTKITWIHDMSQTQTFAALFYRLTIIPNVKRKASKSEYLLSTEMTFTVKNYLSSHFFSGLPRMIDLMP